MKKKIAIMATVLLVFSYTAVVYARWLSNPNIVPMLVGGIIYSLSKSKNDQRFLVVSFFLWAVVVHFQIAVAVAMLPSILISIYLLKIKPILKFILASITIALVVLSSYLVFDLRNDFIMTQSLLEYTLNGVKKGATGGGDSLANMINPIVDEITRSIFPLNKTISLIILSLVSVIFFSGKPQKKDFLPIVFLVFGILPFIVLKQHPLFHYLMLVHVFLYLFIAVSLGKIKNSLIVWVLVATIAGANLHYYFQKIPSNESIFLYPAQSTYLGDMKRSVDYIYQEARGKEFTYDYYTVPYWQEEAWVYLFQWYGKSKYGYAPMVDRTNQDRSEVFYTIMEPNEIIPVHRDNWYGEYKKGLDLLDTYESGRLKVEKRRIKYEN